jgi:hypothetical protein
VHGPVVEAVEEAEVIVEAVEVEATIVEATAVEAMVIVGIRKLALVPAWRDVDLRVLLNQPLVLVFGGLRRRSAAICV